MVLCLSEDDCMLINDFGVVRIHFGSRLESSARGESTPWRCNLCLQEAQWPSVRLMALYISEWGQCGKDFRWCGLSLARHGRRPLGYRWIMVIHLRKPGHPGYTVTSREMFS